MDCFHSRKQEENNKVENPNGYEGQKPIVNQHDHHHHHTQHHNQHGYNTHNQGTVYPNGQMPINPYQNGQGVNGTDYGMVSPIRPSWANPNWNHQTFDYKNMKIDNAHNLPIKPIQFNPMCKKCHGSGVRTSRLTKRSAPCKECYSEWGYCKSCYGTGTSFKRNKVCKKCGHTGLNEKAMKGYTSSSASHSD